MSLLVTWYDNAAFRVNTGEEVLWFDPSVSRNADSPIKVDDVREAAKFVFTTHGDPGHFVNSVEITKKTGARFVGSKDLCDFIVNKGQLPADRVISLNFGETKTLDDIEIHLFQAEHPEMSPELKELARQLGGVEARNGGFVVRGGNFSLCLLGDCVHSEVFRVVGQMFPAEIGMIPIQGRMRDNSNTEEAAENAALIARDLKIKVLFPVVQYTKEKIHVATLKRKLSDMGSSTRVIFEKPGIMHRVE